MLAAMKIRQTSSLVFSQTPHRVPLLKRMIPNTARPCGLLPMLATTDKPYTKSLVMLSRCFQNTCVHNGRAEPWENRGKTGIRVSLEPRSKQVLEMNMRLARLEFAVHGLAGG